MLIGNQVQTDKIYWIKHTWLDQKFTIAIIKNLYPDKKLKFHVSMKFIYRKAGQEIITPAQVKNRTAQNSSPIQICTFLGGDCSIRKFPKTATHRSWTMDNILFSGASNAPISALWVPHFQNKTNRRVNKWKWEKVKTKFNQKKCNVLVHHNSIQYWLSLF